MMKLLSLVAMVGVANAKVYYKEQFGEGWKDRWVESSDWKSKSDMGEWKHTAGDWYADENDKGIMSGVDAKFYGISAKMDEAFDNDGKTLVVQYQVKHNQQVDCGGAYIKLLGGDIDQAKFGGDTKYNVMFGPDICGHSTRKTHVIFNYNDENLLTKNEPRCETDQLSHVYTLIVKPDNTYEVRIDGEKEKSGYLEADWDFLEAKEIKDPDQSKPEDWVDERMIPDPEESKPEGWDDVPEQIPDPDAEKPEDWDDEDDGEWEPPMLENPEYKGEWKPTMIDNPDYKGEWVHPMVANPEYKEDPKLHARCSKESPCGSVGFELWQVKAGTIFDNIIVTDSVEEAEAFMAETWGKLKDDEKAMFDKIEEERRAKEDEERKAREEERKALEEEEDDEDEDDEDELKEEL